MDMLKHNEIVTDELLDVPPIPRRLSTVRGDRGYRHKSTLALYNVYLDGKLLTEAAETVDVDKGYVRMLDIIVDKDTRKPRIVHRDVFGKVEIVAK